MGTKCAPPPLPFAVSTFRNILHLFPVPRKPVHGPNNFDQALRQHCKESQPVEHKGRVHQLEVLWRDN
jgi:hypothetical protein